MRLLDLFCKAGGCTRGYQLAGFHVTGVDNQPQPRYVGEEFYQADAFEFLAKYGHEFDAIHASPPCQRYTVGRHIHQSGKRHPDLVGPTRQLLMEFDVPWVIENVIGAPMGHSVMLCGLMFRLRVLRHRLFESSHLLLAPPHPKHPPGNLTDSCQGYSTGATGFVCVAGHNFVRTAAAEAMGIDWMKTREELAQAIPPAYTLWIGRQLAACLRREVA